MSYPKMKFVQYREDAFLIKLRQRVISLLFDNTRRTPCSNFIEIVKNPVYSDILMNFLYKMGAIVGSNAIFLLYLNNILMRLLNSRPVEKELEKV